MFLLLMFQCFVSMILNHAGSKVLNNPVSYQESDYGISVGISTNINEEKKIDDKTWYYQQYIFGKTLKVLSIVNVLLVLVEALLIFNISQATLVAEEYNIVLLLAIFTLIPIFIYRAIAVLYAKYKAKHYDPDDMFNTFNQNYDPNKYKKVEVEEDEIEESDDTE